MTQHHSATVFQTIDTSFLDLVFTFLFSQIQDQFFFCLSIEARKYQIDKDRGVEIYVLKTVVSTHSIYLTDNTTPTKHNNGDKQRYGEFRWILVFSAPPLCFSLPAIRLSSVTIPSNRAEVLDNER